MCKIRTRLLDSISSIHFGQLAQQDVRRNKKGVKKYHLFKKRPSTFWSKITCFSKKLVKRRIESEYVRETQDMVEKKKAGLKNPALNI
jgi:hypothetical protein